MPPAAVIWGGGSAGVAVAVDVAEDAYCRRFLNQPTYIVLVAAL